MMETGYLLFRAEGEDISGFLTLASEYELTIQKFCKADGVCFGYLPPGEYRTAARLARSVDVRLQILEKNGVSFALQRYRRRLGFIVWPVVFTALLLFSQCFLWAVDVTGCETLHEDTIRQAAAELGLRNGLFLPSADLKAISDQLRQDFPGIATLSLNRVGSRVEIALNEAVASPPIQPDDPCNLIAAKTGTIEGISVTRGQHQLTLGQSIAEGQLLVSGITETPDGKISYEHAAGQIMAQTTFEKTFSLRLTQQEQSFTGEERIYRYADLFGKKIPLFLPDSLMGFLTGKKDALYESRKDLAPLTIGGVELPIGIQTEKRTYYTLAEKSFTEAEALIELNEAAEDYEKNELASAEILGKDSSAKIEDEVMTLTIQYTCLEDIALPKAIEIEP